MTPNSLGTLLCSVESHVGDISNIITMVHLLTWAGVLTAAEQQLLCQEKGQGYVSRR